MEPAPTITPPQDPPNPPVTQKESKSSLILIILLVILVTALFLMVAVLFTYSNKVNRLTQAVDIGNSRAASLSEEKQLLETENTGLKEQAESHESEISGLVKKLNDVENPPYFTNYMPIKFMFTLSQKLGQSFYQTSNMTIAAVTLKGSFGAGNDIILRIYELSDPKVVELSNLIAEGSFPTSDIVKEESFKIALDESVELETGKTYFMSIEAEDDSTQAGVAFAEENIVDNGRMYVYTREIGGNGEIIDSKHSWHPNNNYDVIFTLQEAYLN